MRVPILYFLLAVIQVSLYGQQDSSIRTGGSIAGYNLDFQSMEICRGNLVFSSAYNMTKNILGTKEADSNQLQRWNFHMQNTYVVQGDPGFSAKYSGPNSLSNKSQVKETATLNFFAGLQLWQGAEAHIDFLAWQGFGLSQSFGIEAFPNGDAFKAGTASPNFTFAHLFIRQIIGFGGEQEKSPDDQLTLSGKQDISRLTFSFGRLSPLDICDNNSYAHDPHTEFMNWAMMANLSWDYGQNTVGYTTGFTIELNQPKWSLRYGAFSMPRDKNGFTGDDQLLTYPTRGAYGPFLRSWAMMIEFERRYSINVHPGVIRFLSWLDEADFANYKEATAILLANPPDLNVNQGSGVTIPAATRSYRLKYGFGLNWEQELAKYVGIFSRLGWTPGQLETWTYTDVDWTGSIGLSVKGAEWHRHGDAFGLAAILSGASNANQKFLEAGGTDMLDGDGSLNYDAEKVFETYYDFQIWRTVHATLDYQFVANPAFNRDRGPVSIFGVRLHLEF
jgi:high affinity Mn2+ porin